MAKDKEYKQQGIDPPKLPQDPHFMERFQAGSVSQKQTFEVGDIRSRNFIAGSQGWRLTPSGLELFSFTFADNTIPIAAFDINGGTALTTPASADELIIADADASYAVKKITFANIQSNIDHGSIGGLSDDDHSQYALLAGRAGGQTLVGGTLTTQDLTLQDNAVDANTITITQAIAAYTHISNDGSDHSFIDQSVISGASPTFDGANFTGLPASAISSGTLVHERGGIEADISAITTGDVLAGTSAGAIGIVAASGASDGDVLTIQADGTAAWETPAAGTIGGSSGSTDNALIRANGTGGSTIQGSSATATLSDNNDLTLYDATNDGNPVFAFGASATERLTITATYDSGAQTLDYVLFQTDAASATADKGEFRFNVDGTEIGQINDSGINVVTGKAYYINDASVLNATTLGAAVVNSSLTSVGTLASGNATAIVDAASASAAGKIEIATNAETLTGTDTGRAVTPDDIAYIGAFTRWTPFTTTLTYSSAATHTNTNTTYSGVVTISGDYTAIFTKGTKLKFTQATDGQKWGVVAEDSTYGAPNTTVKIFMGTNNDLDNEAISSVYYSYAKAPAGFPMDKANWTVQLKDTTARTQTPVTGGTVYNPGGVNIEIPLGDWRVEYDGNVYFQIVTGASKTLKTTLSTANNSESDSEFTAGSITYAPSGGYGGQHVHKWKNLILTAADVYYFNIWTPDGSVQLIGGNNAAFPLLIHATCNYL